MIYDIIEEQFDHYYDVLTNEKYWYDDKFRVLNYEAGTGKTLKTYEFLGRMYKEGYSYRVLYIQPFSNEGSIKSGALYNTVKAINEQAGSQIAAFVDANTTKSGYKYAVNAQVLCITHNMYAQICRGRHKNLIKDRDILIIDEFPNLFEQITIDDEMLDDLQKFNKFDENIMKVYRYISKKLEEAQIYTGSSNKMILVKFDNQKMHKILKHVHNIVKKHKEKEFIRQFIMLFENIVIFEKNKFYTFNNKSKYVLLKNNIILDANGGFDYRYKINPIFELDNQSKVFSYQNSVINYYQINTSKQALNNYKDFIQNVIEEVKENNKKYDMHLIITDKNNVIKYNSSLTNVRIDYFGNLLGKNDYRDFNKIWIFKTPNYSLVTYVLQWMFYSNKKIDKRYSLDISRKDGYIHFKNKEFEKLRESLIVGEFYQAIKRINRANTKRSEINIFTNSGDEVINKIKSQFPRIDFMRKQISVSTKDNNTTKRNKSQARIEAYKKVILNAIREGKTSISKAEIRSQLNIDKAHFNRLMKDIEIVKFNNLYKIENRCRELVIKIAV